MTTARETLLAYKDDPSYFEATRDELEPLWLAAANERLAEHRATIPVLARVADEAGVAEIRSLDDLVPLLFAHSSYKSYPDTFIAKGRWDLMNRWLDTLSSTRVEGVDVDGVRDQDDWIERLRAAGHWALVTSGTTGKNSFLPATAADRDLSIELLEKGMERAHGPQAQDRVVVVIGPKYGSHRAALHFRKMAEAYGRPDATFFLTEEPMRVSEVSRMAELRQRIAAGTAMPSEIAAFERDATARQAEMATQLDTLIDRLLEHRHEPMLIAGFWAQFWTVVERARARGIEPGDFHPDTKIAGGGGNKGTNLPPDFKEQILGFFGIDPATMPNGYGMSELSAPLTAIDSRYRAMPWVIPLILDDAGEKLVGLHSGRDSGLVEGRFAFFDVALDGRWGGVITGDHVTADFSTPNVSVVTESITRYSATQGGDDKLTCAGTVDAYVRGMMA